METKHQAAIWLEQYFEKLRNSKEWSSGAIALTLDQQEAIIDIVNIMCNMDSDRFCGGGD